MKYTSLFILLLMFSFSGLFAQERVVKIDFESGSFKNNPNIPFNEPLLIQGESGSDIEMVKVNIYYEGKNYILHSFIWNRIKGNNTQTFNILVPPVLRSNTKYDFEIITYRALSASQRQELLAQVENRLRYLLMNNIYYNGKEVVVNKPREVYNKIEQLIAESFKHQESKNMINLQAPSLQVLDELKRQNDFKFGRLFGKSSRTEKDEIANKVIEEKVTHLVDLISSELLPYVNSQLVQHHRLVNINAVETDKEPFSLPVNIGMYAWNKTVNINNTNVQNIDFTPGLGVTIPFSNKSRLTSRAQLFDSFGFSAGVLFEPVMDNNGTEFVTPGVNLPVYAALGFRLFKVIRLNAGVILLGEKGVQNFENFTVIPTAGLALELNLWMGIKK